MGCVASVKPATKEQCEEMCARVARGLCVVTLQHTIDSCIREGSVKIKMPDNEFEKIPAELEKKAVKLERAGQGAKDTASKAAGALGSMLGGAAKGMAGKAAAVVGDTTAAVMEGGGAFGANALREMAKAFKAKIDEVNKEFQNVATEVAKAKTKEIIKAYNDVFEKVQFINAYEMIRGADPKGRAEYDKVPGDNVTKKFMDVAGAAPKDALKGAVGDFIKENKTVKGWDDLNKKVREVNDKLKSVGLAEFAEDPCKVEEYIVDKIVEQIAVEMGKYEAVCRKTPEGKREFRKQTFALCLSGQRIMSTHFEDFKQKAM